MSIDIRLKKIQKPPYFKGSNAVSVVVQFSHIFAYDF